MAREIRKKSAIPMAPRPMGRGGCPFSRPGASVIDYKDVRLLSRYISEKRPHDPQPYFQRIAKKTTEIIKRY